eukprot:SAG31_NODE_24224_length_486_cov_1.067183_1_plen_46_part_10
MLLQGYSPGTVQSRSYPIESSHMMKDKDAITAAKMKEGHTAMLHMK